MVRASGVGVRGGQQNWEQQVEGRARGQGSEHTGAQPSGATGSIRTQGSSSRSEERELLAIWFGGEDRGQQPCQVQEQESLQPHPAWPCRAPQSQWFLLGPRFGGAARSGLSVVCKLGHL